MTEKLCEGFREARRNFVEREGGGAEEEKVGSITTPRSEAT